MLDSLSRDNELLVNIQARWSELAELLEEINSHSVYEDLVYRFYYQSFKVYSLQNQTKRIVEALKGVAPSGTRLSPMFEEIYQAGASGKQFELDHNPQWTAHTRVFLEAFFHAKIFSRDGREVREGIRVRAYHVTKRLGCVALSVQHSLGAVRETFNVLSYSESKASFTNRCCSI